MNGIVRISLVFAVIFWHFPEPDTYASFAIINPISSDLAVKIFFILSGGIIAKIQLNPEFSAVSFLQNRFFYLFIPLALFLSIYFLGYYFLFIDKKNIADVLFINFGYLFLPSLQTVNDKIFMPHVWSLSYEFYFYFLALFVFRFIGYRLLKLIAVILLFLFFFVLTNFPLSDKGFFTNLIFFFCSWSLVRVGIFQKLKNASQAQIRLIVLANCIILFLLVSFGGRLQAIEFYCSFLALNLIVLDTIIKPIKLNRLLGRVTLYVYLVHLGVNYIIWSKLSIEQPVGIAVLSLICSIFLSLICIVTERFIANAIDIKA